MVPVISIDMIYPGYDSAIKVREVRKAGFSHIEFAGWREKDIQGLSAACAELEVKAVNFSAHRLGSIVSSDEHKLFLDDLREAVEIARMFSPHCLMVLTNALSLEGRVRRSFAHIPPRQKFFNTVTALRRALEIVPREISLVLEPLNTKTDHPGYYLHDPQTAVEILKEVDDPRCMMLCDLYHFGIMGWNLTSLIEEYALYIGYLHVADFPGRHELQPGSEYWHKLLSLLQDCGYNGYVGFEYVPEQDSRESLANIAGFWDEFEARG